MRVKPQFKLLTPTAKLPTKAYPNDLGTDIYSDEDVTIWPGLRAIIKIGISGSLPDGYGFYLMDKSGLAKNDGLTVLAGVIEGSYRKEWEVIILNTSGKTYEVKQGQKIAQYVVLPTILDEPEQVEEHDIPETPRGTNGFGSTGNGLDLLWRDNDGK